jgi:hypothetical protein
VGDSSASDATPAVSPSPRDLSPRQPSLPTASGVVSGKRRLVSERWAPRRTPTTLALCGMSTPSDAAAAFAEPSPLSLPQSPDHLIPDVHEVHEQPSLPESPEFDASGHERQPRWQTPSAANAAAVALLGVDDFDGAVSTLSNNAAARRVTPTPNFEKLSRRLAASWAGHEFDSEDDDKADSTTARSTVPGRSILRRPRRNAEQAAVSTPEQLPDDAAGVDRVRAKSGMSVSMGSDASAAPIRRLASTANAMASCHMAL